MDAGGAMSWQLLHRDFFIPHAENMSCCVAAKPFMLENVLSHHGIERLTY
jgi:hypothetical protein